MDEKSPKKQHVRGPVPAFQAGDPGSNPGGDAYLEATGSDCNRPCNSVAGEPAPNQDRREYMRRYQLAWVKARRRAYLADKACARCGSADRLEVDHIDPNAKVSHNVWSWSEERRRSELAKCQVLCRSCHERKTARENRQATGERNSMARLTEADVIEARRLRRDGWTLPQLVEHYGVSKSTINDACRGKSWGHLPGGCR